MNVEAVGYHQTRGPWEAHRTFLGDWAIHWIRSRKVEVTPVLPEGAYIKSCTGEQCKRCG